LLLCGRGHGDPAVAVRLCRAAIALSAIGLLQYLASTLQFIIGIVLGEHLRPMHIFTFGAIWRGCAICAWDSLRALRSARPKPVAT